MSSSAALENSIVFGLNKLFNLELTKHQMILISQKAEHNYVGVQCGIMDQYASMFGIENGALLLDCKTLKAQRIPIDFGLYEIVLINSNVKHELSESAYNDRHAVCTKVSKLLEKESLREVSFTDLEAIKKHINNEDYNKVLYVLEEIERVEQFAKSVEKQDLESMGNLLFQSHKGLSEKYKVSCNELDFLVSEAKKCDEVIGARMMGGGFGGCTINLVLKSELQNFENKISKVYQNKFEKACDVYKVKLSEGTRLV